MSTETTIAKPGIKTTEFWSSTITTALLIINAVADGPVEVTDGQTTALAAGIVAAYGIGRAIVKAFAK